MYRIGNGHLIFMLMTSNKSDSYGNSRSACRLLVKQQDRDKLNNSFKEQIHNFMFFKPLYKAIFLLFIMVTYCVVTL